MKTVREFLQLAVGNRQLLLTYLVLLPVVWFGTMSLSMRELQTRSLQYSKSDLVLLSFNAGGFSGILIAFLLLCFVMYLLRFDFLPVVLIRQKSKRSIWFHQAVKAMLSSLCLSLYSTGILLLYAELLSSVDNNWDSYKSVFTDELKYSLEKPVSLWLVVSVFLIALFLFVFTISLLYLLVRWWLKKEIVGCIAVIVYLLYCSYGSSFLNYLHICTVGYKAYIDPARLLWPLLAPLLWIGVLLGSGALLANRAEFYSAGKK